jgi:short chain dehydrogenase
MEGTAPMSMSAQIGDATKATSANSVSSGVTSAASASSHPVAEPVAGLYPVPPPDRSAGPIQPGRRSSLAGKIAVVTGAARGIGRAIATELAANGADVVAIDIAGPVSPTADAMPATEAELAETVDRIRQYGRRAAAIKADIRDSGVLRQIADQVEHEYGKIDIVVANAAIQGWKPLMEMGDMDWHDQIEKTQRHRQHGSRLRPQDGRETLRPFHPPRVDAGQGGDKGWCQLFGIEVEHTRVDEVRRPRSRPV